MNNSHYLDGPPRHRLQAAATPTTSRNASAYEQVLLEIAAGQQLPTADIDLARWNSIAVDYAELEQLPAIGQRVLGVNGAMITWASSEHAQPGKRVLWRRLADVVRYGIDAGDVELADAATTLLRARDYRAMLAADTREVQAARNEAKQQADDTAAAAYERQNGWVHQSAKQAVELGRPVDPRARASIEPLTPDYTPLEHYDKELAKINAVERTVTAREAQALATLLERAEKLVHKEDT